VVLVNAATLREAEQLIESCESCNPDSAGIPFDNILDRVTRLDPSVTDLCLEEAAKCPKLQSRDFWKRLSSSPTEMKMPSAGSSAEPQFAAREDGAGQDEYDNGVKEVLDHHFEVEPVLGMHEFSRFKEEFYSRDMKKRKQLKIISRGKGGKCLKSIVN
jgi:hypothetical protein